MSIIVKELKEKLDRMPDIISVVAATEDGEIDADVIDVVYRNGIVVLKLVI